MNHTTSPWFTFVLAALATWRLSHLLASEDGPAGVVFRLRKYLVNSFFGRLMDCFGCVSLWVAAPFALFVTTRPLEIFVAWLALSGGAMMLQSLLQEPAIAQQPQEPFEQEPLGGEQPDGMLR
jgi:hypothetical protein